MDGIRVVMRGILLRNARRVDTKIDGFLWWKVVAGGYEKVLELTTNLDGMYLS